MPAAMAPSRVPLRIRLAPDVRDLLYECCPPGTAGRRAGLNALVERAILAYLGWRHCRICPHDDHPPTQPSGP